MKRNGNVWSVGCNKYGQLGDGSTSDRLEFVLSYSGSAKAVAVGIGHSMVLDKDGSVWATGQNIYGQLGDGSSTGKSVFVKVF